MTRRALVLVDLQEDFLQVDGLLPDRQFLVQRTRSLLARGRAEDIPVFHVQTLVGPNGEGCMPHWAHNGDPRCREGTQGASPPIELAPLEDEGVYYKTHYSAFDNPCLDSDLRASACDTLTLAGVHSHACIHATALDAYRLGYAVEIVSDCVASYDPATAELILRHLAQRVCRVCTLDALLPIPSNSTASDRPTHLKPVMPGAYFGGEWHAESDARVFELQDPCDCGRIRARVALAGPRLVQHALEDVARFMPQWCETSVSERLNLLRRWMDAIHEHRESLVTSLIEEIGKPRSTAEAEYEYAIRLLAATINEAPLNLTEHLAPNVEVHYRPRGMVLAITPWNNPLAIPIGKLAPALAFGNSVVWKPAPDTPLLVETLLSTLAQAGVPASCVAMLHGDSDTVHKVFERSQPHMVTFTGSETVGRQLAMTCAAHGVPLQAELGGNNAAVIGDTDNVERVAQLLAKASFSFSGQRCTAPRRLIVVDPHYCRFCDAFRDAAQKLNIGDPHDRKTEIGPLRSEDRVHSMQRLVRTASEGGGHVLTGGKRPPGLEHGAWFQPTAITGPHPDSPVVQDEAFGPVVVLEQVDTFAAALNRANSVRQGLRAVLYSDDPLQLEQFPRKAEAGIVHLNPDIGDIHPVAPFLGWKRSGLGLPEHGRWDQDQYTVPTSVYHSVD